MASQPSRAPERGPGDALVEVPAPASLASSGETEPIVLARGNLFCVLNRRGDIAPAGARDLGLFHEDTRHLSYLELAVGSVPATVLSAEVGGSSTSQIDLTLTDRQGGGFLDDPHNFLHVRRRQLLDEIYLERISATNHLRRAIDVDFHLRFGADFADIFEVRGARRPRRGRLLPSETDRGRMVLGYLGTDGTTYRTVIRFLPDPTVLTTDGALYRLHFQPGETLLLEVSVQPVRHAITRPIVPHSEGAAEDRFAASLGGEIPETPWIPFDVRAARTRAARDSFLDQSTRVHASNNRFEAMLGRAMSDIDALRLRVGTQSIVGAGIPWYAAPFGRDSIITSLELLSVSPALAVETLRLLAAYQGERDDPWREEEPGRIMHELRRGEMARAGEIPHSPYYGTIDATPLWLALLGETWRWTGNDALIAELWPSAERALAWIDRRLEAGHGLLYYRRALEGEGARGLVHQGWKDSCDGISFPDGTIAEPPIALVEVQGYVVAAFEAMSRVRRRLGDARGAHVLRERAQAMRRRIDELLWVPETGYYALGIDGYGHQIPTLSSNPGHLAFARALIPGRAARVAEVLLGEGMYSGWGVRTVARGQAVYNPLSYHNGTVWPHDNALIALGLAQTGHVREALRIFDGLYAASLHFRDLRLPELFCGTARGEGDFLVHYPVSCSPQAWASGAFFLLLQAVLGIRPDAPLGRLTIRNPHLPEFLPWLDLEGMHVGASLVSLHFERHGDRTHVDLADLQGEGRLKVNIEVD